MIYSRFFTPPTCPILSIHCLFLCQSPMISLFHSIQTPLVNRRGHNHQITFLILPFCHQIGYFHFSHACNIVLNFVHYLKSTCHRSYVLVCICMGYLPTFHGQKAFVPTTLYPASMAATCTSRSRQAACFSPRFLVPSPPRSDKWHGNTWTRGVL